MSSQDATKTNSKPTAKTTTVAKTGSTALTRHGSGRPVYQSNIPAPEPQVILEEDDYIDALSKIIERDFFPDLARLKRQHAYLDAVEMNDFQRIQAAARELAGNDTPLAQRRLKTPAQTPRFDRAGLPNDSWTPARVDAGQATPSWGDNGLTTPAFPGSNDTPIAETPFRPLKRRKDENGTSSDATDIDTSLSLDQFQMRYTSEDNASFNEIIDKINAQNREKYRWLYDQEKKSMRLLDNGDNSDQKLLREAGEDGESSQALVRVGDSPKEAPSKLELALSDRRSGVISTWEYKAKNALMYPPEGLGTNLDEKSIRGQPKEIVHRNTGFQGQDLLVINQAAAAKFDPTPYMKANVTDSPKVAGYSFVSSTPTPNMSQMGDDPEMMTWGTIEDEPLLISSGIQSSGPSPFKLPPTPRRELIAQKLSEKASKSFREGSSLRAKVFSSPSASALAQYRESMGGRTPTPRFNSPYSVASSSPYNKTPGGSSSHPTRMGSPNPKARTEMLSPAAKNGADSICAVCKEPCDCIQVSENVDDLPANIQPFFRPLMNLCYETLDTWKFQEQNMTELVEHLRSKTKRQHDILVKARTELRNMKILKSENRDLKTENKRAKTENENLRSENETLKQQIRCQMVEMTNQGSRKRATLNQRLGMVLVDLEKLTRGNGTTTATSARTTFACFSPTTSHIATIDAVTPTPTERSHAIPKETPFGQLLNGQAGYGYQQTPVLPFAQGLAYAAPQQTWPRVDPMAAGQEGMALPGRVVVSAAQPTGIPYPVLAGSRQAAAAGGGGGGVIQDPLIRMRNSASAARTTWQQRQQQQQQQAQLQQQQQAQLQQQQHPQHYGYPMVLRSAVPRPVVLRNLRT
ncbi:hypothetical protein BGX23_000848 [Mortierella sp. AD031]|nr:hypothetical protein BGX23_000848 [Mortierella sp. AD031]KAG0213274.1 hypothetical protein BGX33_003024 [Mortierella sp. NVP41]